MIIGFARENIGRENNRILLSFGHSIFAGFLLVRGWINVNRAGTNAVVLYQRC